MPIVDPDTIRSSGIVDPDKQNVPGIAGGYVPQFVKEIGTDLSGRLGRISEELTTPPVQTTKEKQPGPVVMAQQSPEKLLHIAGEVAGGYGDIIADLTKGAVRALTPQGGREKAEKDLQRLSQTSLGQAAIRAWKQGAEAFGKFSATYPRIAKDIESAINIVSVIPFAKAPGEAVAAGSDLKAMMTRITPEVAEKELATTTKQGLSRGIMPMVGGKRTFSQSEKYFQNGKQAVEEIINNKPNLKITTEAWDVAKLPENLREFSQAIEQTKQGIYKQYHQMALAAGDAGANFDSAPIIGKLDALSQDLKRPPKIREYAESLKAEIEELQGASPEVVEARIADLNSSLEGYYAGRTAKAQAQVDASVAELMREELDNKITNATGEQYQDLKNRYGSLKEIERDVNRRAIVDGRKATKGFFDLPNVFTGAYLAHGILTMNPSVIGAAGAAKGLSAWYKWVNNPNTVIKKMFKDADRIINKRDIQFPKASPAVMSKPGSTAPDLGRQTWRDLEQ